MARIRSVHPDLHRDKTLAQVSASAERTFVRLWCHLDDDGRGEDDADLLKADLYPRHRDMDADAIEADLAELESVGLVIRYRVRGERFLSCKPETWKSYQRPQKKQESKLPGPEEADPEPDPSDTATEPVRDQSDTATGEVAPVGEGRGEGEETVVGSADADSDQTLRLVDQPDQFEQFWDAYPRHHTSKLKGGGGNKVEARKRWKKLKPAERDEVMQAVGPYATLCAPGGQFPKNAERFLSNEYWRTYLDLPDQDGDEFVGGVRKIR